MYTNFLKFTKMQISALSQIVWLQLLCIVLYPMFFTQLNADNDIANIITYTTGLVMLSYLIIRNFAFLFVSNAYFNFLFKAYTHY